MTYLRAALLNAITREDVEAAARPLVRMARDGNLAAIKELLDRTIGKAPATVELSGQDGEPLGVAVPQVTGIAGELALGGLDEQGKAKEVEGLLPNKLYTHLGSAGAVQKLVRSTS